NAGAESTVTAIFRRMRPSANLFMHARPLARKHQSPLMWAWNSSSSKYISKHDLECSRPFDFFKHLVARGQNNIDIVLPNHERQRRHVAHELCQISSLHRDARVILSVECHNSLP